MACLPVSIQIIKGHEKPRPAHCIAKAGCVLARVFLSVVKLESALFALVPIDPDISVIVQGFLLLDMGASAFGAFFLVFFGVHNLMGIY